MAEARRVVVTGASRGLGLATAAHLYAKGWTVVAAVRSPDDALARLRASTGASVDDARLAAVRLDLDDPGSIDACAQAVLASGAPPFGLVHNAGIAGVGCLEELPMATWEQIFATNFLGPVRFTRAVLPAMRVAGRGRIVMVSSMGATRGMPGIGAYSASKAALERWGESLSFEIAPFGLGVTVIVAGSFKTDILELTPTYADLQGPYAPFHTRLEARGRRFIRFAARPERFGPTVARALEERRPFVRHAVGVDARLLVLGGRVVPTGLMQRLITRAVGVPRPGPRRGERGTQSDVRLSSQERETGG
jgi:NAD(P)-dependent dehydrogenase (short-subunit alcohol dehydrogenase family)